MVFNQKFVLLYVIQFSGEKSGGSSVPEFSGELAPLFVSHIARWGADKLGHLVLLLEHNNVGTVFEINQH